MRDQLCNPNASDETRRLYAHLREIYGQQILLAQQEFPGKDRYDQEMDHIFKNTGCLPAIRGLDFMHDDYAGTVQRAIEWHEKGGLVSICWHTGLEGKGYQECLAETPDFEALFEEGSELGRLLFSRWDEAADALQLLQEHRIPVLWRPFHEFNGGWFWWGKGGSEVFIRLWRRMFEYFTQERKLDNLIWVLGFSGEIAPDWYPGDDCCDIVGSDTYELASTHAAAYHELKKMSPGKMLAFHECGEMPEIDDLYLQGSVWLWMMPWHNEWLLERNMPQKLQRIYHDPRVITLNQVKKWL